LAWEDYEYTIELRVALKETQLSKIEFELTKLEGKGYAIGASIGIIG
jgi:hypothetical protein